MAESERVKRARAAFERRTGRAASGQATAAPRARRRAAGTGSNLPEPYTGGPPVLNIDISGPDTATRQVLVRFPGGVANIERDQHDRYGREMSTVSVEADGETPFGTWLFGGRYGGTLSRVMRIIKPLYGEAS